MRLAIIIFAYNRPKYLKRMLESYKNAWAIAADTYAFIDYSNRQSEIMGLLTDAKIDRIICRTIKYGLRKNILSGISEIFDKGYDAVIVLEDDLLIKQGFFYQMRDLLNKYAGNLGSVTGYFRGQEYSRRSSSLGWGTWKEVWKEFETEWNFISYIDYRFSEVGEDLPRMYENARLGKIDSWAISWAYFHFKYNLLCRSTQENNIIHIGTKGTHFHWYSIFGILKKK